MSKNKHSYLYRNGLSIVFILLFLLTLAAQAVSGWKDYNDNITEHGLQQVTFPGYLATGHFSEATFENFQSEFLQMALYVVLTISLRQIGSAESKDLDKKEEVDRVPDPTRPDAPGPVKKGGWRLAIYQHSLSLTFLLLFLISWGLHLYGSFQNNNEELIIEGKAPEAFREFIVKPVFWFETFQNWQSEFLSIASIVILTIFLRQKGSPESKPVDAAHMETGK